MECPKCEREIKKDEKKCPYCQYDLVNRPKIENETLIKFKHFIKEKSLIIESILTVIIFLMIIIVTSINGQKEIIEKQYDEFKAKSENTSKTLQTEIKEKNNKIVDNEKKINELQQEEKKKEINESIKLLESERQKLEQEKQTLTTQIEELKKASSTVIQSKSSSTSTSNITQNTNSATVYVTNTGKKYHKSSCSYLKKSKIQISLSEAQRQEYTACSRCY